MNDASGWVTASVVTVCLLLVAIGLVYLHPHTRRRRYEREAARFQRDPRVGDHAGYHLYGDAWRVGMVEVADSLDARDRPRVLLELEFDTALGTERGKRWWFVDELTYFPPSTPLGRHLGKPEVL